MYIKTTKNFFKFDTNIDILNKFVNNWLLNNWYEIKHHNRHITIYSNEIHKQNNVLNFWIIQ